MNLAEKSALVYYKTAILGVQDICDFIEDMGFEASIAGKTGTTIHVCCIHVDGMTCNSCVQTIEGKARKFQFKKKVGDLIFCNL